MKKSLTFSNGLSVPNLGLGTWQVTGSAATTSVREALEAGYRHIDTADAYGNHKEVGKGIQESGVKREDIFLTTKVWRDNISHDGIMESADRFLEELQTDYIDLLLIHWPNLQFPITESLTALQELQSKKVIKAIGVSNFTIPLLEEALETGVEFVTNQVEFHPSLNQKELKEFCDKKLILLTAYSPIAQGADLKIPLIQDLAKKYTKSPSQIVLNWILNKDIIVIPRATKKEHIIDNLEALNFDLDDSDSAQIDALDLHTRVVKPAFAPFED